MFTYTRTYALPIHSRMLASRALFFMLMVLGTLLSQSTHAQPPGANFYTIQDGIFEQNGQWSNSSHNGSSSGINPGCIINGNVNIYIADSLETNCDPLIINGNAEFEIEDGGNLIINGDLQISGNAEFDIEDDAALTINGDLDVTGSGELDLSGDLTINGNVNVTGNGSVCGSGTANVSGTIAGSGWCLGVSTLPVELVHFDASTAGSGDYVTLEWTTATEIDNDRFIVERSMNGLVFDVVTQVGGAGNSRSESHYTYEDGPLDPGTYYYRLTQVDYDGDEERFDVAAVGVEGFENGEEPCDIDVYPNPCVPSCKAVLDCPGSMFRTYVIDGYGREIAQLIPVSKFNRESVYHIDPNNFMMPGIYFIKAVGEGKEVTKKVMIK